MQVKLLIVLFTEFFAETIARRCRPLILPPPPPVMSILYDAPSECSLQTQCYDDISTIPQIIECGCPKPMRYASMSPTMLDCRYEIPKCYDRSTVPPTLDCACDKPMRFGSMLPTMLDCGYEIPICYDKSTVRPMLDCRCDEPMRLGSMLPPMLECGCVRPKCNEELVLPPMRVELPQDLGYFPSAVPLVASYFNPAVEVGVCAGASVPVTSPYCCLTLAAPVCPDIAPLVRPLIL